MPEYLDFKLTLDGEATAYRVAAEGPGGISIDPTPSPLDRTALSAALDSLQQGTTLAGQDMRNLGTALFDALFPRRIIRALERAYDALPRDASLRLKLKILPPELSNLPWELMFDPDEGRFLAARLSSPMVRMIEGGTPGRSLLARRPLRVLHVQASPPDLPLLSMADSEAAIGQALGQEGELVVLRDATVEALRAALREQPAHVLHFDGHGRFDPQSAEGYLYLCGRDGQAQPLGAEVLASLLDGSPVRLVVLSACETAVESRRQRFAGVAQQLMRTVPGLPAVVAMQLSIADSLAIAFSRELYAALAQGYPIDAAVVEGRKAIMDHLGPQPFDQPDWAIPVLYLRTVDGDILREEADARPSDKSHRDTTIIGDQYNISGFSSSTAVVRPEAPVIIGSGTPGVTSSDPSPGVVTRAFSPVIGVLRAAPENSRTRSLQKAAALIQEAVRGVEADDARMARLIQEIVNLVPAVSGEIVAAFSLPALAPAAGPATQAVLDDLAKA